jgi:hypothetical protein
MIQFQFQFHGKLIPICGPSCKLILTRFSARLKFQYRTKSGNKNSPKGGYNFLTATLKGDLMTSISSKVLNIYFKRMNTHGLYHSGTWPLQIIDKIIYYKYLAKHGKINLCRKPVVLTILYKAPCQPGELE